MKDVHQSVVETWPVQLRALEEAWSSMARKQSETSLAEWTQHLAGMTSAHHTLVGQGLWTSGPSSIMSVLGLSHAEVVNCRAARWAFDPLARHGLGAAALAELGRHLDVSFGDPAACVVEVEVPRPNSRADIVISGGGDTVVFEAKIDAPEGDHQAARLEEDWPEAACLVFLTPRRRRSGSSRAPRTAQDPDRWVWLTWGWIAGVIDGCLAQSAQVQESRMAEARNALAAWVRSVQRSIP